MIAKSTVPVTLFTGYLGSGKTTLILNLIRQLPAGYRTVWLKNEYGDINIDKVLAEESNIVTAELMNGCICCVLVGKLHDALTEILAKFSPDRVIIESSGTAFPLPIILQINRISNLSLDGVINVIDALNFSGYADKGHVARMQAGSTDLIIINKAGMVDERQLDNVLDDVYDLNPSTPKVKTQDGNLDSAILLGLDTKLAELRGGVEEHLHEIEHDIQHPHPDAVGVYSWEGNRIFDIARVDILLEQIKFRGFIRIKGVVWTDDGARLLSWVFGRWSWQELQKYTGPSKIVFMGKNTSAYTKLLPFKLESISVSVSAPA